MRNRVKIGIVGATLTAAAATGTGIALAAGGDDGTTEVAITGSALEQASAAALESTGGGRVSGTEVGDEESYYEVEVTLPDGSQVDVQLDKNFNVVSTDADVEDADD